MLYVLVELGDRNYVICRIEPYQYQLRAYIYQARDLLAGDKSGLSGIF